MELRQLLAQREAAGDDGETQAFDASKAAGNFQVADISSDSTTPPKLSPLKDGSEFAVKPLSLDTTFQDTVDEPGMRFVTSFFTSL